jgi:hypothetical protein
MSVEAMEQALEALEHDNPAGRSATITALRQAIEQAEKQEPVAWRPIDTAPIDNARPLYLARFYEGELRELDFDGAWEYWEESWEMSHINGWWWVSANGIEEPTHWAYQDEPLPYTAPPQREWVGLTSDDVISLCKQFLQPRHSDLEVIYFARAIEAKLKEKNAYGWQSVENPTEYLDDLRGGADLCGND